MLSAFQWVDWIVHRLKSRYDDIISAIDDFFDHWNPSTVTQMKEVYELQGEFWRKTSFGRIPFEYLDQPKNFSTGSRSSQTKFTLVNIYIDSY